MKPAFFNDLTGLLIGPIFVLVKIMFKLGYRPNLEKEVTAQAVQLRRQLNATENRQLKFSNTRPSNKKTAP